MSKSVSAALCGAAVMFAASSAGAANLLVNGSFEGPPANNFGTYYRGASAPDGWSRVAGLEAPDIVSDAYSQGGAGFAVLLNPKDGDRFLDMNGASHTGGLYQDVTGLLAGSEVTLTFWVGQWAQNSAGTLVASLRDAANPASVLASETTAIAYAPGAASAAWVLHTLTALAPASGSVRVQFTGDSASTSRGAPGLDLVGLDGTVVPEPASWVLMILGFGAAGAALRRRQALQA